MPSVGPEEPETRYHARIIELLLSALPPRKEIHRLWQAVTDSEKHHLSYYHHHSSCANSSVGFPPEFGLSQPIQHPIILARRMLIFATALQGLPPVVDLGLSKNHVTIMDEVMEAVISLVNVNDALMGSLEALDNLMLQAMFHMNCGLLKRSWMTLRRAVMCAQMLGLHRAGHHRFTVLDAASEYDPETMWHDIVYMERVGSLLLGLPSSTGMTVLVRANLTKDIPHDNYLSTVLGNVAARILDRNQIESPQQALNTTESIDKEMISISEQMPSSYWRPLDFTGIDKDSADAFGEVQRAFSHARYYTLIIQLHTPYMLCPTYPTQNAYSRMACVNASRETLSHEVALRSFAAISAFCRLSEFLALIAGVTLMLAHASSHCSQQAENLLSHQRLGDRALVERVLECLEFMADLQQDLPAVRCIALLKDLLYIEEDAAHNHANPQTSSNQERSMMIVRMPFYGNVKISGRGIASVTLPGLEQEVGQSEGLHIGGIGSVRVVRPTAQAVKQVATNVPSDGAAFSAYDLDVLPVQYQHDFDPSLDDWAFQGIDTAFFESLMREAGTGT
ncbi:hypothetical protein LTR86_010594 [Recurvomyces mirabilis]|nr:hypothetical protein LTR86_010594 [Recurvomyces mirabilis]